MSNDPFADQLLLSNGAQASSRTTPCWSRSRGEGIAQVVLQEPVLNIKKGVVADEQPGRRLHAGDGRPGRVQRPGTLGPRFTGTITSAGLAATPIDSNLRNVDAGDLVTFAIVVENTGTSPKGAFDVLIRTPCRPASSRPGSAPRESTCA